MNYSEARQYIEEINQRSGSILGLERIRRLMALLGNPQDSLRIIHVAGTNGKGSFGAFLAGILSASGLRCGRFVSPAVLDYREQIQIDGTWISEADVAWCVAQIREVCETHCHTPSEYPTSFEIETAMAWLYFQKMAVDVVILEVGLGGRYDSTNIIRQPALSVITSISFDHMAMLGHTLTEIAYQKAGIIKAGCPVLVYDQCQEVLETIRSCANQCQAPLETSSMASLTITSGDLDGLIFDYKDYKDLQIRMAGDYQAANAALAVDAAMSLRAQGGVFEKITEETLRTGLKAARWEGRFEKVHETPLIIVDGAHNPDGAHVLKNSVKRYLKDYRILLVAGIFKDKEYHRILETLSEISEVIYTHTPPVPRGLLAELLAEAAQAYYPHVTTCNSLQEAMAKAVCEAEATGDLKTAILCFGSLSTISDLKNWLRNQFSVL